MTEQNLETSDELKKLLTSLPDKFDYLKKIISHIDEHIDDKHSERIWMCNVSLQHYETRMMSLCYDMQELRRLLYDNDYLVHPPWADMKYLNEITRYVQG